MILAIDCGNTNTVFALYTTNKQIKQLTSWRINNDSKRTADLYYPWLLKMFEVSKFDIKSVIGVSVASVVPETLLNIKSLIKKLETDFSRNERAALAFTIIDNLRQNREK